MTHKFNPLSLIKMLSASRLEALPGSISKIISHKHCAINNHHFQTRRIKILIIFFCNICKIFMIHSKNNFHTRRFVACHYTALILSYLLINLYTIQYFYGLFHTNEYSCFLSFPDHIRDAFIRFSYLSDSIYKVPLWIAKHNPEYHRRIKERLRPVRRAIIQNEKGKHSHKNINKQYHTSNTCCSTNNNMIIYIFNIFIYIPLLCIDDIIYKQNQY